MTPPDARVLIVATLIIAGVPVAVHEYRIHAHRQAQARNAGVDGRMEWGAASASPGGVRGALRGERDGTSEDRQAR